MRFIRFTDASAFDAVFHDGLVKNQIANNLILRIVYRKPDGTANLMSGVVDDDGSPLLAVVCTPPYGAVMAPVAECISDDVLKLAADATRAEGFDFVGVNTETALARRFAEIFSPGSWHSHAKLVSMLLDKPAIESDAPGFMRDITEHDATLLAYWEYAFAEECRIMLPDVRASRDNLVRLAGQGKRFIWEDGLPVSVAGATTQSGEGMAIGFVATPPVMRGKGYCQALVSRMCNLLMREQGYPYIVLYADADNPISCHIYRKMGFVDCRLDEDIRFD